MRKSLLLEDGTKALSVTKVLDENLGWNKKILIDWYYNKMRDGVDPKKINNESKKIGSYVHDCIDRYECGKKPDKKKTEKQDVTTIIMGERAISEWIELKKEHNIDVQLKEESFVSEKYRYGGRIDNYGTVNCIRSLLDTKTSKGIYLDHIIQLSAYRNLLVEHGYGVDNVYVLSISKDPTKERILSLTKIEENKLDLGWRVFQMLLNLAKIKELMNGE